MPKVKIEISLVECAVDVDLVFVLLEQKHDLFQFQLKQDVTIGCLTKFNSVYFRSNTKPVVVFLDTNQFLSSLV